MGLCCVCPMLLLLYWWYPDTRKLSVINACQISLYTHKQMPIYTHISTFVCYVFEVAKCRTDCSRQLGINHL